MKRARPRVIKEKVNKFKKKVFQKKNACNANGTIRVLMSS